MAICEAMTAFSRRKISICSPRRAGKTKSYQKETPFSWALATVVMPYTNTYEERFASIHSNPPGIPTAYPAIVEGDYGKGKFIWMACVPEFESEYEYGRLLCDLICRMIGEPSVQTTAPADVEIVPFTQEGAWVKFNTEDFRIFKMFNILTE